MFYIDIRDIELIILLIVIAYVLGLYTGVCIEGRR